MRFKAKGRLAFRGFVYLASVSRASDGHNRQRLGKSNALILLMMLRLEQARALKCMFKQEAICFVFAACIFCDDCLRVMADLEALLERSRCDIPCDECSITRLIDDLLQNLLRLRKKRSKTVIMKN